MNQKLLSILLLLAPLLAFAQKMDYTFHNQSDKSKDYYLTVYPDGAIKGALVLLPGFGDMPANVLPETDIYKHASEAGLLTIIPMLGDQTFFYVDGASHQKLDQLIDEVFNK